MTEAAGVDTAPDIGADTGWDIPADTGPDTGADMSPASEGREVDIRSGHVVDTDVIDGEVDPDAPSGDMDAGEVDGEVLDEEDTGQDTGWVDPVRRLGPAERTSTGGRAPSWWADKKGTRGGFLARLLSPLAALLSVFRVRSSTGHVSGHGRGGTAAWMSADWRAQRALPAGTPLRAIPVRGAPAVSGGSPRAPLPSGQGSAPTAGRWWAR